MGVASALLVVPPPPPPAPLPAPHLPPPRPARSLALCARLVSEQEVQALCIDAATANVEAHYAYICDAFSAFVAAYRAQHAAHAGERRGRHALLVRRP